MRKVWIVGHRGAAGHAPENTLAAIQKGIALGVDFVEIDVQRTADGTLVALHDDTVDRTTNGKGRVDRLSLREIQALNVGNGQHIPTLEEVLEAVAGKTGLMVELKIKGAARQAVEAVRRVGFKDPLIYASFLHDELVHVRAADPMAGLMALFGRGPWDPIVRASERQCSYVGFRHETATRPLVEACHGAGLLVFAYTVDRPADIQRALAIGVDGVISNFPDRIGRP
jgi:glycerophosphoryl diester phosphodiesterase